MRTLRMLASLALAASVVALPALASAQDAEPSTDSSTPLALAPDGQLPLQGTPWRLRAYRWRGVDRQPGPEVAARMTLGPEAMQASGGCTRFSGRYGAVGSAIHFDLRGLKENDCAEQTTMVQLAMVDGLRKATSFEIVPGADADGHELVLRSTSGTDLLRFGLDETGTLDAGEWRLVSYSVDGEATAADAGQPAVLTFRSRRDNAAQRTATGPLTGSTGCNGIVGEFYRHADVMSLGELERTEAPCTPTLQAQEAAMLSVLDATSMWVSLPPDRLIITAAETGDSLDFVSSRPLEGTTWLLTKIPGTILPPETVTLQLSGGEVSGEGPCGPYSAIYASDGGFITFSAVEGAGDDTCASPRAERALLSALRSTVMLERDQNQLRMRDSRGNLTARFKTPSGP